MNTNEQFKLRRALINVLIPLSIVLFMTACVSVPLTVTPRIACGTLIPPELRADVPGVIPPGINATVGDYGVAFDGQTGRLDTANSNKHAAIGITDRCDAINAELASRVTAPWWQFWRR